MSCHARRVATQSKHDRFFRHRTTCAGSLVTGRLGPSSRRFVTNGASPSSAASAPKPRSRLQRAIAGFKSAPGSHLTSFLILHEVTAVGLLVPFYYFFQWSDSASTTMLGGPFVAGIASIYIPPFVPWIGGKKVEAILEQWIDEGTAKAARFGVKYGAWGFSKLTSSSSAEKEAERAVEAEREIQTGQDLEQGGRQHQGGVSRMTASLKGHMFEAMSQVKSKSVMNAVAAYLSVKALFVPRIALSVAMTPFFARRILEPSWRILAKVFRRGKPKQGT